MAHPIIKKLYTVSPHHLIPKAWKTIKGYKRPNLKSGLIILGSLFLIFCFVFYVTILKDLPTPSKLSSYDIPQTTKIYDRHGTQLYEFFASENRTIVKLSNVPKYTRLATIAIEDKEFYKHQGINPIGGVLRAFKTNIFQREFQGGSTITQQLVKSALLSPERTIQRKIKEVILAPWAEILYSKDQILEMYLNQVAYGGTYYGIGAAAQGYFGKNVKDLTLAESALLAGLPQAPTTYSPFGAKPELAKERMKQVLRRMVEDKYITAEEAKQAQEEQLHFQTPVTDIKAPHFVMYVKEKLVEHYGLSLVEKGGLKVTTTLDLPLQEYAQASVAAEVADLKTYKVGNGAALVTRPPTGEILAMVGSKDYFASDSGNYNVTTGLRQPGSSIKPINYATGMMLKKATPATMFLDVPTCFSIAGQPQYCPKNYDGSFHGPVHLRFALGNSYNIPAVKMLALNSLESMMATASAMGITTLKDPSRYGLSLTLGGGEVHMTDMATAFGVFANTGIRRNLVSVLKVEDRNGKVLEEFSDPNFKRDIENLEAPSSLLINGPRVLSPEVSFLISHILLDNNARQSAFGPSSLLRIPNHGAVSVKTGTTDDYKDNWTIGFTPNFLVASWVGNNDGSAMSPYLVSGVTGAAPIWNAIMTRVLKDQKDLWPKQPSTVVGRQVCVLTGTLPPGSGDHALPADQGSCETRFEYFAQDNLPPAPSAPVKQAILIDKGTGRQAKEGQTDNVEPQEKTVLSDGITKNFCIDCPYEGMPQPTPTPH